jgi:butyrate kinase
MHRILAINLGSTSTKLAYYEDRECVYNTNIKHDIADLQKFSTIWEQYDYRYEAILREMRKIGIRVQDLSAVVTRGGHTIPIEGGVYRINEPMLAMSASEKYGNHATDLGLKLAYRMSKEGPVPLTVDPPTTDEFEPFARYTGLPEIKRRSSFHALNHRAVAKQYAKDIGRPYKELNLIGAHMGGGITVVVHRKGRMVDANNGILGDGPFSSNRVGTLPVGALMDMCYSGEYTRQELRRKLNGNGGLTAFLGEPDVLTVEKRIENGDQEAEEVLGAMCYQTAKEIASLAAVLKGKVDAIYFTGGVAYSERVTGWIRERVEFLAPVVIYPGEYEMRSLALSSLDALCGTEPIKEL